MWYNTECTTFAPATIAPVVNPNVKHNPNPNPNPNPNHQSLPYPGLKTQSSPSLLLFVVGDINAGAIVARANIESPQLLLSQPMNFSAHPRTQM